MTDSNQGNLFRTSMFTRVSLSDPTYGLVSSNSQKRSPATASSSLASTPTTWPASSDMDGAAFGF